MSISVQEQIITHAPQQLVYEIICNLDDYQLFIPWCKRAGYTDTNQQATTRKAYIVFAIGPVDYRLETQNTMRQPESIQLTLISGPVKDLVGCWSVQAIDAQKCEVSVDMTFAWKNRLVQTTLGKIFSLMCRELVHAFKRRAEDLYKDTNTHI